MVMTGRAGLDDSSLRRIILSSETEIMSEPLKDSYNRPIRDLRVSLTDRCNFRCFYCLPHGEPPIAPKEQMLSYEEIEYVCDIFVELGIEKIRLTGGEPMMRRDIEQIDQFALKTRAQLQAPKDKVVGLLQDLALTTNGYFLPHRAQSLKDAGLDRITISLDSLKRDVFKQMTGVDVLDRVIDGIVAAKEAGLEPIKINAVIVRGHNEDEVADFAAFAREHDVKMRFIEFMPLIPDTIGRARTLFPDVRFASGSKNDFLLNPWKWFAAPRLLRAIVLLMGRREKSESLPPSPKVSVAPARGFV